MRVLGIETSCDETGLAIYDGQQGLMGHIVHSQIATHAPFGGVVPELASRDHLSKISPLLTELLVNTKCSLNELDGIAYTKGPGLVGALLVGATFAKSLALSLELPIVGVHHLEGHLLAPFLEEKEHKQPEFPFLALLVSGGHTELIKVAGVGLYELLGDTLDDAVGEAFDKTAKLLGIPYPGGAALAQLAEQGNPDRFQFPRPMVNRPGLEFSFSGLKTFALRAVKQLSPMNEQDKADIAYAFQAAVVDTLTIKCRRALQQTHCKALVLAGGVGANVRLRESLSLLCKEQGVALHFPALEFCTDNGAMIAFAGHQRLLSGEKEDLSIEVLPRWPLQAIKV